MSTSHAADSTPTPVTEGATPPAPGSTAETGRAGSVGGPGWPVTSHDGQSTLKLHAGISVIATILCLLVVGIFIHLGTITPAIIFAVVALICVGIYVGCRAKLAKVRRTGPESH
ncbi:hypothetical protein [Pseudonocardia sp. N23]|uniref:hypothetical protein n=1 Tax=Pseudonocardia sp. N23 TaxID=1987376 RepID=UPI000BFC9843|nr:hypothetical protein [Pseudonocardia sp. N23]GAY07478.1 hypothetical protein TOK_3498 [Pseudonocardia sp. N23]